MQYVFVILGLLAGIHAFNYGRWLMRNNNRFGGYVVYVIVIMCVVMPIYHAINAK
jgi:hypothetical protein